MNTNSKGHPEESYADALRGLAFHYETLIKALSVLKQIDELDDPEGSIDDHFRNILEALAYELSAENCSLMMVDETGTNIELRAAYSPLEEQGSSFGPGQWPGTHFRIGQGIVGRVIESAEAIRVNDVSRSDAFIEVSKSEVSVSSLLCFPLQLGTEVIGALTLSHSEPDAFTAETEHILRIVAGRTARLVYSHTLRAKLAESEAHYRSVTECVTDAVLVFDHNGDLINANSAVAEMTGTPAQAFLDGKNDWVSGIHPDDRAGYAQHMARLQRTQLSSTIEYRYVDDTGNERHFEERGSVLEDPQGKVAGIVSVVRDVTERKQIEVELNRHREHLEKLVEERSSDLIDTNTQLEQEIEERKQLDEKRLKLESQMQQVQKLESLGVLAGGIAHDFNNLLQIVIGHADLIQEHMLPERGAKNISEIQKAARQAAQLTNQLLSYSGRGKVEMAYLDLSQLVQEMTQLMEVSHSKRTEILYRFEPGLPAIEADPSQIRQIVMNLITNASEAIGEASGEIHVKTGLIEATSEFLAQTYIDEELLPGPYVYLEVADTGGGIAPETREQIFDPFFTTKFTGRGLGLAAVLGIVHRHGGTLKLTTQLGKGTTFTVLFPPVSAEPTVYSDAPDTESSDARWRGEGVVLFVDDSDMVLTLGKLMLEKAGFSVLTASDGQEAVDLFRTRPDDIACAVLDLTMPRMGGEETIDELRRIREDVPVVLASGYSDATIADVVADKQCVTFIRKPYEYRDLVHKIRLLLDPEATQPVD